MLTPSHLVLAEIVFIEAQNKGLALNKKSLKKGSVGPDFSPNLFLKPHYFDQSYEYLQQEIKKFLFLGSRESEAFSFRLGNILHYIADYFCMAHNNQSLREALTQHLKYEFTLDQFFRCNKAKLIKETPYYHTNIKALKKYFDFLERQHKAYLCLASNFERDCLYAITMCLGFLYLVVYQLN